MVAMSWYILTMSPSLAGSGASADTAARRKRRRSRSRKLEELDGGLEGEREEERTSNVVPLGRSITGFG